MQTILLITLVMLAYLGVQELKEINNLTSPCTCPELNLSGKIFKPSGSVQKDLDSSFTCIYDIQDHILYQKEFRNTPKNSDYLL